MQRARTDHKCVWVARIGASLICGVMRSRPPDGRLETCMRRFLAVGITVLFGIIPATLLLLALSFVVWVSLDLPQDFEMDVPAALNIGVLWLAAVAAVFGYAALLLAAKGLRTPTVVAGLVLGMAATAYGVFLAWDRFYYADWYAAVWLFGSPFVVAAYHAVASFFHRADDGGAA